MKLTSGPEDRFHLGKATHRNRNLFAQPRQRPIMSSLVDVKILTRTVQVDHLKVAEVYRIGGRAPCPSKFVRIANL